MLVAGIDSYIAGSKFLSGISFDGNEPNLKLCSVSSSLLHSKHTCTSDCIEDTRVQSLKFPSAQHGRPDQYLLGHECIHKSKGHLGRLVPGCTIPIIFPRHFDGLVASNNH